ncbi:uncharacterized protein LOC110871784 [Helianthus annuus]|uniref:uncharacterized protein LOC110871784 n=1 Tax=Helianthus annuus TaxID=4232 RepID=UPI000B8F8899|nr:uncharacterized protein LOC110871784 [Helianthus annuus]
MMFEHEHPLNLTNLWSEEENEDYEEDKEENEDEVDAKQDFRCLCSRCHEEINWFHRYYYSCSTCSDFSIHKFCAELPDRLEDICEAGHTLGFCLVNYYWNCSICNRFRKPRELLYRCNLCDFKVDANCAKKRLQKNIIYHPSHKHPLVRIPRQILDECDACGKEHKGIFYHCPTCASSYFIHSDCAFLPKKLQIQHTTNDIYSHIHPLTLAYSFPKTDIESKRYPRCRVCRHGFSSSSHLWLYKCEKCRYYTHLDCATSPATDKMIKNYDDVEHPDLLHLPFPDPSYSLLKHLFFKESGSKTHEVSHQHPLILEDSRISYHDPTKRIELLCNGCLRPITSGPVYVCSNEEGEHCNFVLHEWCSRLPTELKDHPRHPRHPLILHSKVIGKFFGVFACRLCGLNCNGFAYCCVECDYYIDVNCAFLPKEITHNSHPNHLLTFDSDSYFSCHSDDFVIHLREALLIPETTTHKCDKHPMKLSYFPIENHMSDYFCEICEEDLNPEYTFYHCRECMQSMHTACAPSILRYETYAKDVEYGAYVHRYVNVKFGGTYNNIEVHPHPLSFVQGVESDGLCHEDGWRSLHYEMIFKCLTCEFVICYDCMKSLCEEKN